MWKGPRSFYLRLTGNCHRPRQLKRAILSGLMAANDAIAKSETTIVSIKVQRFPNCGKICVFFERKCHNVGPSTVNFRLSDISIRANILSFFK